MKYRAGYKYQLAENFSTKLRFQPVEDILTEYILFQKDGTLTIKEGYAWDGPSGPTFDTADAMTPSLVHDAGYQLLRAGLMPEGYKTLFDKVFEEMCQERGMLLWRREMWYLGVHLFGEGSCKLQQDHILEAP